MSSKKTKKKKNKPIKSKFISQLESRRKQKSLDFSKEFDLALVHFQNGNLGQAESIYRQILSVSPDNPMALFSLGLTVARYGKIDEAIRLTKKAIALNPRDPAACNSLGLLFIQQGKLSEATECFRKAIAVQGDYVKARFNLGNVLKEQGFFEKAIEQYNKTIALQSNHAHAYAALGDVYKDRFLYDIAIENYLQALALNPKFAEVFYSLGDLYKIRGSKTEAAEYYKKALAVYPGYAEVHRSFSSIHKYVPDDVHIRDMEHIFSQSGVSDEQKMHLSFALGKAYEDICEYEKSFYYLRKGNAFKRKTYEYSPEETSRFVESVRSNFTAHVISQNSVLGNKDRTPIFILGLPRSGTSLVEQILSSHPEVHGAGELTDFVNILLRITGTKLLDEAFKVLLENPTEIIPLLGSEYLAKLHNYAPEALFITDKMPNNFFCIGAIRMALPSAKIINCVRNPMDTCFSIYKNYFSGTHKYAYDLEELGQYYLSYRDLMQCWHDVIPGLVYDISYENLVSNQESETKKLLHHCGLSWDEKCLSFYKTQRTVSTISADQVRQPIYSDSVQLWKKYETQLQTLYEILAKGHKRNNTEGTVFENEKY